MTPPDVRPTQAPMTPAHSWDASWVEDVQAAPVAPAVPSTQPDIAPQPNPPIDLPPVQPQPIVAGPPRCEQVLNDEEVVALARLVLDNPNLSNASEEDAPIIAVFVQEVNRIFGSSCSGISREVADQIGRVSVERSRVLAFFSAGDTSWRQLFVDPSQERLVFRPNIASVIRTSVTDPVQRMRLLTFLQQAQQGEQALQGLIRWRIQHEMGIQVGGGQLEAFPLSASPAGQRLTGIQELTLEASLPTDPNIPQPLTDLFLRALRAGALQVTVRQNDDRTGRYYRLFIEIEGRSSMMVDSRTLAGHAPADPTQSGSALARIGITFTQRVLEYDRRFNPNDYHEGIFCLHTRDALYQYLSARNLINPTFNIPALSRMLEQRTEAADEAYARFLASPAPSVQRPADGTSSSEWNQYDSTRLEQLKEAMSEALMVVRFANSYARMQPHDLSVEEQAFVRHCLEIAREYREQVQEMLGELFNCDARGHEHGLYRLVLSSLSSSAREFLQHQEQYRTRQRADALEGYAQGMADQLSFLASWRSMVEDDAILEPMLSRYVEGARQDLIIQACAGFPDRERRYISSQMTSIPAEVATEMEAGRQESSAQVSYAALQRRYAVAQQLSDHLGDQAGRASIVGLVRQQLMQRSPEEVVSFLQRLARPNLSASLLAVTRYTEQVRIDALARGEVPPQIEPNAWPDGPYNAWQEGIREAMGESDNEAQNRALGLVGRYYSLMQQLGQDSPEALMQLLQASLGILQTMLGSVPRSSIPADQLPAIRDLFIRDPQGGEEPDTLIFKPGTTLEQINACDVPEETKRILREALMASGNGLTTSEWMEILRSVGQTSEDTEVAQLDLALESASRLSRARNADARELMAGNDVVFTPRALDQAMVDATRRSVGPELLTHAQMEERLAANPHLLRHMPAREGDENDFFLVSTDRIVRVRHERVEELISQGYEIPVRPVQHLAGRSYRMTPADVARSRPDAYLNGIVMVNFATRERTDTVLSDPFAPRVHTAITYESLRDLVTLFGATDIYTFTAGMPGLTGPQNEALNRLVSTLDRNPVGLPEGMDGQAVARLLARALLGQPFILFSGEERLALINAIDTLMQNIDSEVFNNFAADIRAELLQGLLSLRIALSRMEHREGLSAQERDDLTRLADAFSWASDLPAGSPERAALEAGITDHFVHRQPPEALLRAVAAGARRHGQGFDAAVFATLYARSIDTLRRLVRSLEFQAGAMPPEDHGWEWTSAPFAAVAHYLANMFRAAAETGRVQDTSTVVAGLPSEESVRLIALARPELFAGQPVARSRILEAYPGISTRLGDFFEDPNADELVFKSDSASVIALMRFCREIQDTAQRSRLTSVWLQSLGIVGVQQSLEQLEADSGYQAANHDLQVALDGCESVNGADYAVFRTNLEALARGRDSSLLAESDEPNAHHYGVLPMTDVVMGRIMGAMGIFDEFAGYSGGDRRAYVSASEGLLSRTEMQLTAVQQALEAERTQLHTWEHDQPGETGAISTFRRRVRILEQIERQLTTVHDRLTMLSTAWDRAQVYYEQRASLELRRRELVYQIQYPRIDRDFYQALRQRLPQLLDPAQQAAFWQRVATAFGHSLDGQRRGVDTPSGYDRRPAVEILDAYFNDPAHDGFYLNDLQQQPGEPNEISTVRLAFTALVNSLPREQRLDLSTILPGLVFHSPMLMGPAVFATDAITPDGGVVSAEALTPAAAPDAAVATAASPLAHMGYDLIAWLTATAGGETPIQNLSSQVHNTAGQDPIRGTGYTGVALDHTRAGAPLPTEHVSREDVTHFFAYLITDVSQYLNDADTTPVVRDELQRLLQTADLPALMANDGADLLALVGGVRRDEVETLLRENGITDQSQIDTILNNIFTNYRPEESVLLFREDAAAIIDRQLDSNAQAHDALLQMFRATETRRTELLGGNAYLPDTDFQVFDSTHAYLNWDGSSTAEYRLQLLLSRITETYFRISNIIYQSAPLDNPEFETFRGIDFGRAMGDLNLSRRQAASAGETFRAVQVIEVVDDEPRYGQVTSALGGCIPGTDICIYPGVTVEDVADRFERDSGQILDDSQAWINHLIAVARARGEGTAVTEARDETLEFMADAGEAFAEQSLNFRAFMGKSINVGYGNIWEGLADMRRAWAEENWTGMEQAALRISRGIAQTTGSFAVFEFMPFVFLTQVLGRLEHRDYSGAFGDALSIALTMMESFLAFAGVLQTFASTGALVVEVGRRGVRQLRFRNEADREAAQVALRQRFQEMRSRWGEMRARGVGTRLASYHVPGIGLYWLGRDVVAGGVRGMATLQAVARNPFSAAPVTVDPVTFEIHPAAPRGDSLALSVFDGAVMRPRTTLHRLGRWAAQQPGDFVRTTFQRRGRIGPWLRDSSARYTAYAQDPVVRLRMQTGIRGLLDGSAQFIDLNFGRPDQPSVLRVTREEYFEMLQARLNNDAVAFGRALNRVRMRYGRNETQLPRFVTDGNIPAIFAAFRAHTEVLQQTSVTFELGTGEGAVRLESIPGDVAMELITARRLAEEAGNMRGRRQARTMTEAGRHYARAMRLYRSRLTAQAEMPAGYRAARDSQALVLDPQQSFGVVRRTGSGSDPVVDLRLARASRDAVAVDPQTILTEAQRFAPLTDQYTIRVSVRDSATGMPSVQERPITRQQIIEILFNRLIDHSDRVIVSPEVDAAVLTHFQRLMNPVELLRAVRSAGQGWLCGRVRKFGHYRYAGRMYVNSRLMPRTWGERFWAKLDRGFAYLRPRAGYRTLFDFGRRIPIAEAVVRRYALQHRVPLRQARAELAGRLEQTYADRRTEALLDVLGIQDGQSVSRRQARRRLKDPEVQRRLQERMGQIDVDFNQEHTVDRLGEILRREGVPSEAEAWQAIEDRLTELRGRSRTNRAAIKALEGVLRDVLRNRMEGVSRRQADQFFREMERRGVRIESIDIDEGIRLTRAQLANIVDNVPTPAVAARSGASRLHVTLTDGRPEAFLVDSAGNSIAEVFVDGAPPPATPVVSIPEPTVQPVAPPTEPAAFPPADLPALVRELSRPEYAQLVENYRTELNNSMIQREPLTTEQARFMLASELDAVIPDAVRARIGGERVAGAHQPRLSGYIEERTRAIREGDPFDLTETFMRVLREPAVAQDILGTPEITAMLQRYVDAYNARVPASEHITTAEAAMVLSRALNEVPSTETIENVDAFILREGPRVVDALVARLNGETPAVAPAEVPTVAAPPGQVGEEALRTDLPPDPMRAEVTPYTPLTYEDVPPPSEPEVRTAEPVPQADFRLPWEPNQPVELPESRLPVPPETVPLPASVDGYQPPEPPALRLPATPDTNPLAPAEDYQPSAFGEEARFDYEVRPPWQTELPPEPMAPPPDVDYQPTTPGEEVRVEPRVETPWAEPTVPADLMPQTAEVGPRLVAVTPDVEYQPAPLPEGIPELTPPLTAEEQFFALDEADALPVPVEVGTVAPAVTPSSSSLTTTGEIGLLGESTEALASRSVTFLAVEEGADILTEVEQQRVLSRIPETPLPARATGRAVIVGPDGAVYVLTLPEGMTITRTESGEYVLANADGTPVAGYEFNEEGLLERTENSLETARNRRARRALDRELAPQRQRALRDREVMRQYRQAVRELAQSVGITDPAQLRRLEAGDAELRNMVREGLDMLGDHVMPAMLFERLSRNPEWLETPTGRRFSEWMRSGESQVAIAAGWQSFVMGIITVIGVEGLIELCPSVRNWLNEHPPARFAVGLIAIHLANTTAGPLVNSLLRTSGRADLAAQARALWNLRRAATRAEAAGLFSARYGSATEVLFGRNGRGGILGRQAIRGLVRGVGGGFWIGRGYEALLDAFGVPTGDPLRSSFASLVVTVGVQTALETLAARLAARYAVAAAVPAAGEIIAGVGVAFLAIELFYTYGTNSYQQSFDRRVYDSFRAHEPVSGRLGMDGPGGSGVLHQAIEAQLMLWSRPGVADVPGDRDVAWARETQQYMPREYTAQVLDAAERMIYGDPDGGNEAARRGDLAISEGTRADFAAQIRRLQRPGETREQFAARVQRMLGQRVNFDENQMRAYDFVREALQTGSVAVEITATPGTPEYELGVEIRPGVRRVQISDLHGIYDPRLAQVVSARFHIPLEGAPAGQGIGAFFDRVQRRMLQDQAAYLRAIDYDQVLGSDGIRLIVQRHLAAQGYTGADLDRRVDAEVQRLSGENDDIREMFDVNGVLIDHPSVTTEVVTDVGDDSPFVGAGRTEPVRSRVSTPGSLDQLIHWAAPDLDLQRVAFLMGMQNNITQLVSIVAAEEAGQEVEVPADLQELYETMHDQIVAQYRSVVDPSHREDPSEEERRMVASMVFAGADFIEDTDRQFLGSDGLVDPDLPMVRQVRESIARLDVVGAVAEYAALETDAARQAFINRARITYAEARQAGDDEAMAHQTQILEACGDDLHWLEDQDYMVAMEGVLQRLSGCGSELARQLTINFEAAQLA